MHGKGGACMAKGGTCRGACIVGCMARDVHGKGACVQGRRPLKQVACILLECFIACL